MQKANCLQLNKLSKATLEKRSELKINRKSVVFHQENAKSVLPGKSK